MNKTLSLLLAAGLVAGTGPVQSSQDVHSIPVRLVVKEKFHLRLHDFFLDFGEAHQGHDSHHRSIRFSATSNKGVRWSVQLQGEPLKHDDGRTVVPRNNFRFALDSAPGGGRRGVEMAVPASMTTIYTADPAHYIVEDAPFRLGFEVEVPKNQKTGRYSSSITLRLIDNI